MSFLFNYFLIFSTFLIEFCIFWNVKFNIRAKICKMKISSVFKLSLSILKLSFGFLDKLLFFAKKPKKALKWRLNRVALPRNPLDRLIDEPKYFYVKITLLPSRRQLHHLT